MSNEIARDVERRMLGMSEKDKLDFMEFSTKLAALRPGDHLETNECTFWRNPDGTLGMVAPAELVKAFNRRFPKCALDGEPL